MTAAIVVGIVVFYLMVMGAFWAVTWEPWGGDEHPGPLAAGIFWPLTLPVVLGMLLGKKIASWYTRPSRVAEMLRNGK